MNAFGSGTSCHFLRKNDSNCFLAYVISVNERLGPIPGANTGRSPYKFLPFRYQFAIGQIPKSYSLWILTQDTPFGPRNPGFFRAIVKIACKSFGLQIGFSGVGLSHCLLFPTTFNRSKRMGDHFVTGVLLHHQHACICPTTPCFLTCCHRPASMPPAFGAVNNLF